MKYTTGTPARRAARAKRRLNSGKSITTRTPGRRAPSSTALSRRYARYSSGTRLTASVPPAAATAVTSTSRSIPAAAMRGPPIPKSRQPGASARSAWHRAAPWRSPDPSPAASMIDGASARLLDTNERDPGAGGVPHARLPVHDQHAPRLDGDYRRAAGRGGLEALRADHGRVEAVGVAPRHR